MAIPRPPEYYETPEQPPAPQQPTQPEQPRTLPYEGAVYYPNPMELERWRMQMAQREGYVPTDYTGTDWQRFVPEGWEPRGYRKVWYSFSRTNPSVIAWRSNERQLADPSSPPAVWDTTKTIQNYWHDPQNIVRWYNYLNVQDSNYVPEANIDPDFIKNQYSALKYYNGNTDVDNWKPLPFGEDAAYQTYFVPDINGVSQADKYNQYFDVESTTRALNGMYGLANQGELMQIVNKVNDDIAKIQEAEIKLQKQEITEQEYNTVAVAAIKEYNTDLESLKEYSPELYNQLATNVLSPSAAQEFIQASGTQDVGVPQTDEYYLGHEIVSFEEMPGWQQFIISIFSPSQRNATDIEGRPEFSKFIATAVVPAVMTGMGYGSAMIKLGTAVGAVLAPFTGGVSIPVSSGTAMAIGFTIGAVRGGLAYAGVTNGFTDAIDQLGSYLNVLDEGTERLLGSIYQTGKNVSEGVDLSTIDWGALWKSSQFFWDSQGVSFGDVGLDLLSTLWGGPISEAGKSVWEFNRGVVEPVEKEGLGIESLNEAYEELKALNEKKGTISDAEYENEYNAYIAKYIDRYGFSGSFNNYWGQMLVSVQNYLPAIEDKTLATYANHQASKFMAEGDHINAHKWEALSKAAQEALPHQYVTDALPPFTQKIFENIVVGKIVQKIDPHMAEWLRGTRAPGQVLDAYRSQVFSGSLVPVGKFYDLPEIDGQPAVHRAVLEMPDGRLVVYDASTGRQTLFTADQFEATYGKSLAQFAEEGTAKAIQSISYSDWVKSVDRAVESAKADPSMFPGDPDRAAVYLFDSNGVKIDAGRADLATLRGDGDFYEVAGTNGDFWTIRKADDVAVSHRLADGSAIDVADSGIKISPQEKSIYKVSDLYPQTLPDSLRAITDEQRSLYNDIATLMGEQKIWQSIVKLDAGWRDKELEVTPKPKSKFMQQLWRLVDLTPESKAARLERNMTEMLLTAVTLAGNDYETAVRIVKWWGGAEAGQVSEYAKRIGVSPLVRSVMEPLNRFVANGGKLDDDLVEWRAAARSRATVKAIAKQLGYDNNTSRLLEAKDADTLKALQAVDPDYWGKLTAADVKRILDPFRGDNPLPLWDNEAISKMYGRLVDLVDKYTTEKYNIKQKGNPDRFMNLLKMLFGMQVITYNPKAWINNYLSNDVNMLLFSGGEFFLFHKPAREYLESLGLSNIEALVGRKTGLESTYGGDLNDIRKALKTSNNLIDKTIYGLRKFQDISKIGKVYGGIESSAKARALASAINEVMTRWQISDLSEKTKNELRSYGVTDEQMSAMRDAAQKVANPDKLAEALSADIVWNQTIADTIGQTYREMSGGDANVEMVMRDLIEKYGLEDMMHDELLNVQTKEDLEIARAKILDAAAQAHRAGQAQNIAQRVEEIHNNPEGIIGLLNVLSYIDMRDASLQYSHNVSWGEAMERIHRARVEDNDYAYARQIYEMQRSRVNFEWERQYEYDDNLITAVMEKAGNDDYGNRLKLNLANKHDITRRYYDDVKVIRDGAFDEESDIPVSQRIADVNQRIEQRTAQFREELRQNRQQQMDLFVEMMAVEGVTYNGLSGEALRVKAQEFANQYLQRVNALEDATTAMYARANQSPDATTRRVITKRFYDDVYRPAVAEIRDSFKKDAIDAFWKEQRQAEAEAAPKVETAPKTEAAPKVETAPRTEADKIADAAEAAVASREARIRSAKTMQFVIDQSDGILARKQVHDAFKYMITKSGVIDSQARAQYNSLAVMMDSSAEMFHQLTGKPAEAWYSENFGEIDIYPQKVFKINGNTVRAGTKFSLLYDGRAIINVAQAHDFSTAVHELFHVYAGFLSKMYTQGYSTDLDIFSRTYGEMSGDEFNDLFENIKLQWDKPRAEWTEDELADWEKYSEISERFVNGAEEYVMYGRAQFQSKALQAAFIRVGRFLKSIFTNIRKYHVDLSEEMKGVYHRLFELDLGDEEEVASSQRAAENINPATDLKTTEELQQLPPEIVEEVKQQVIVETNINPPEEQPVETEQLTTAATAEAPQVEEVKQLATKPVEPKDIEQIVDAIVNPPSPDVHKTIVDSLEPISEQSQRAFGISVDEARDTIDKIKVGRGDVNKAKMYFSDGRELAGYKKILMGQLDELYTIYDSVGVDKLADYLKNIKSEVKYSEFIKTNFGSLIDKEIDNLAKALAKSSGLDEEEVVTYVNSGKRNYRLGEKLNLADLEDVDINFNNIVQRVAKFKISETTEENFAGSIRNINEAKFVAQKYKSAFDSAMNAIKHGKPELALQIIAERVTSDRYYEDFKQLNSGKKLVKYITAFVDQINATYKNKTAEVQNKVVEKVIEQKRAPVIKELDKVVADYKDRAGSPAGEKKVKKEAEQKRVYVSADLENIVIDYRDRIKFQTKEKNADKVTAYSIAAKTALEELTAIVKKYENADRVKYMSVLSGAIERADIILNDSRKYIGITNLASGKYEAVENLRDAKNAWTLLMATESGNTGIDAKIDEAVKITDAVDRNDELSTLIKEAVTLRKLAKADPTASKNQEFISKLDKTIERAYKALEKGKDAEIEAALQGMVRTRTHTDAFKAWFRNSKVVNSQGEPLIVYHGTPEGGFTEFDPTKQRYSIYGRGFYFVDDPEVARGYAINTKSGKAPIYSVYLSITNPYSMTRRISQETALKIASKFAAEYTATVYRNGQNELFDSLWERSSNNIRTGADLLTFIRDYYEAAHGGYNNMIVEWFNETIKFFGFDGIKSTSTDENTGKETTVWVAFNPTQIKSVYNPGGWNSESGDMLYQRVVDENAEQPPLPFEEQRTPPITDTPPGESERVPNVSEAWQELTIEDVTPVINRMIDSYYDKLQDSKTVVFKGIPDGAKNAMAKQMASWRQELEDRRMWAINYGKDQVDHVLLNYSERRGIDMLMQKVFPFQFWYTQSMVEWARQLANQPKIASWWYKRQELARRSGTRELPSRLAGKIRILAPWLESYLGNSIWINPFANTFGPVTLSQPIINLSAWGSSSNAAAKRILQEQLKAKIISQEEFNNAITNGGPLWLSALTQARQDAGETIDPLSMVSLYMQPAPWWTIPYYFGKYFIGGDKTALQNIQPMPLQTYGNAIRAQFPDGPGKVIGDIIATIGGEPIQKWLGNKPYGELTDYYINFQVANMVVTDNINPDDATLAMIEQSGPIWETAKQRANEYLSYRVPGSAIIQIAQKAAEEKNANWLSYLPSAFISTLFPAGLFPPGEMVERGLSDEYSEAYRQFLLGNTEALENFYDKYPEYGVRQQMFKDPDQRLKGLLINNIWESYMSLPKPNRSLVIDALGPDFENNFVNKETRSYDNITVDSLVIWARKLNAMVPKTPETERALSQELDSMQLYRPEVVSAATEWLDYVNQTFPNYYWLESVYYNLDDKQKYQFLKRNPELQAYWDAKANARRQSPLLDAYFTDRSERNVDINEDLLTQLDTKKQEAVSNNIAQLDNELSLAIGLYIYAGQKISGGAEAELRRIWQLYGAPGDFYDWLDAYLGIK